MSPYLPPISATHGFHTEAEDPMDGVHITALQAIESFMRSGWTGPVGMVFHSAMPKNLNVVGNREHFFELVEKMREFVDRQFPIVSALECNVRREGTENYNYRIDGKTAGFDHVIASVHCTELCGWLEGADNVPDAFRQAYLGVQPQLFGYRVLGHTATFGHLYQYAKGPNWVECYMDVVWEVARHPSLGFEFNIPGLRERSTWDEDLLLAGIDGPTILQPWANRLSGTARKLSASVATDFHKPHQLACMNYENWRLLCDLLEERNLLRHLLWKW